jgi:hypothetical protein
MIAAAITLIAKEQPPLAVVIPSLGVATLAIGGLFAMQIGLHRRARNRARARQSPAPASLR